jgi:4-amino-4-deoxy-L-arabinose transferase-like glycosyltransferase
MNPESPCSLVDPSPSSWSAVTAAPAVALAGTIGGMSAAATPLQQTLPLVWVLTGISVGGALITYAFLVYAIYRFRDPATRRRRYG